MDNIQPPLCLQHPLTVPQKLLMGPGPSNCSARVLEALNQPLLGHLDKDFLQIMDETKQGIKYAFQTSNSFTFAISGSAHCAMETAICNILEKDDIFLVIISGLWGERAMDIGYRIGAKCYSLKLPLGSPLTLNALDNVMSEVKPSLLFICHGESSTGFLQPLEGIGNICKKYKCVLLVDAVASLGATPIFMDKYGIDIMYSGSQKVLSAPPGLSPISFSDHAIERIQTRRSPIPSFYMDVRHVGNYWNCDESRVRYHHTGLISLVYALRETLSMLSFETLERSWYKHKRCVEIFYDGLKKLSLECLITEKKYRLPTITTVKIPDGVNGQEVIEHLRKKFNIDIAGGLGPTEGIAWRIGLMGFNCTEANVKLLLEAMRDALNKSQLNCHL